MITPKFFSKIEVTLSEIRIRWDYNNVGYFPSETVFVIPYNTLITNHIIENDKIKDELLEFLVKNLLETNYDGTVLSFKISEISFK